MKTIILACAVIFLSACSYLKPYPYTDHSTVRWPENHLQEQAVVARAATPPLNNVCHLKTTRRSFKTAWLGELSYHGSAALIEGRYLLTAAHNVYDYPGSYLTSIKVSCGAAIVSDNTVIATFDREQIKSVVHVPRYAARLLQPSRKYEFDYAFIDLGNEVAGAPSQVLAPATSLEAGASVHIAGYPGGRYSNDGNQMHVGAGQIYDMDGNIISYEIETATGNSGGPLWRPAGSGHEIVAVHVSNSGGRIVDQVLIDDWNAWTKSRQ